MRHLQRLMIKSSGRIYFIKADEVDWIGAEGNYVNLHVGREAHLLRETMSHLATKLDPEKFVRIHRSTIVNVDRVKELQPLFSGDYVAILHDGTQLNLSRAYREKSLKLVRGGDRVRRRVCRTAAWCLAPFSGDDRPSHPAVSPL